VDFKRFRRQVGANVRTARWLRGLTQLDAAADVITPRLLAQLERGQGNPTLRTLHLLAQKLRVSVRDLVEVGGEPELDVPLREAKAMKPRPGPRPKLRRFPKVKRSRS
jgi:transcriptional regulator with XRE-family HTH domain